MGVSSAAVMRCKSKARPAMKLMGRMAVLELMNLLALMLIELIISREAPLVFYRLLMLLLLLYIAKAHDGIFN
jgi:hypothetical protein